MFKIFSKEKLSLIWQDRLLRLSLLISLFPFLITLILILFFWRKLPAEIPFFYSLPWGKNQLGDPINLLFLLLETLALGLTNLFLAFSFFKKYPLLGKILVWLTTGLFLLVGFGLIRIIILII